MYNPIKPFLTVLLLLLLAAAPPATRKGRPGEPGATNDAGPTFARDALDLGSADFATRDAATQRLWWAGDLAAAALRQAEASANPEMAGRAAMVLQHIEQGITPSTPPVVIALLKRYPRAGWSDQPNVVDEFFQHGADGVRPLLQYCHIQQDHPDVIAKRLAQDPRVPAAVLLTEGRRSEAEALLAISATLNYPHANEFMAYWGLRPASTQKSAALQQVSKAGPAWARAVLEQVQGDHAAAVRDVATSWDKMEGTEDLNDWLGANSADWASLEHVLLPVGPSGVLRDYELAAVAARLAGDRPAAAQAARGMLKCPLGPAGGDNPWRRALALCYAGQAPDAVKVLINAGDLDDAAQFLEPQLRYAQELALIGLAKGNTVQSVRLKVRVASLLYRLGKKSAADEMLRAAAGENRGVRDRESANLLCRAARKMDRSDETDALLLEGLSVAPPANPDLFESAGFSQPADADCWWRFLKQRQPPTAAIEALRTLHAIADGHITAGDIARLVGEFDNWSSLSQLPPVRSASLHAEATAWMWAGRTDRQMAVLARRANEFPAVESYMALGNCAEHRQEWSVAADAYQNAAWRDPAYAPAVFLHGWAMQKLGDTARGREWMDLAHELPLGDDDMRAELFTAARDRGLDADANTERDIMLATGTYDYLGMIYLIGEVSTDASNRRDYPAAEKYVDQAEWAIAYAGATPTNRRMNIGASAVIDRSRAMALFGAHKTGAAMAEAKLWCDADPNESTGLIAVVRAADDNGARAQADELLSTSIGRFTTLLADFPDSPDLNNQIAWEESRCRRKLDDALLHATRAADLDPKNAAILDTLAETHYQRKEFQSAIDTMKQCIALEPSDPRFGKQLVRFQLGLKTGVADDD